ncbi:MAG TPA: hypothetical protein VGI88_14095 [Verrucomicrobiae bacterium]|jgi:hypothetical protein
MEAFHRHIKKTAAHRVMDTKMGMLIWRIAQLTFSYEWRTPIHMEGASQNKFANLCSLSAKRVKNSCAFWTASLWLAAAICGRAGDVPIRVEDSGLKEVDALVVQLVSQRPAPFPSGYWGSEIVFADFLPYHYTTLQVSNAIAKLKMMGPPIFPALVKHLRDDRYSYSDVVAAWDNFTVGDAVCEVLSDGHYMYGGYKFRKTPTGGDSYLSFKDYLNAKDPEKWAEWAKDKTRLNIQMDFIDWCVAKENERGFVDEAQKKELLGIYEAERKRVREEYAARKTPAP